MAPPRSTPSAATLALSPFARNAAFGLGELYRPGLASRRGSLYSRFGARVLDWVLLSLALPPAVLLALPIALGNLALFGDPRKILFLQTRVGRNGRPFRIFKFRTMRDACQGVFHSWSNGGDEARVTSFGRFLRSTHLDELPQLLNILRGEMAFIGPRPEMVEIELWAQSNVPGFRDRLAIRPGVTGLAQITQGYTGRDVSAYARKLEINMEYLRRRSLRMDLAILVRTVLWMARGRGWSWQAQGQENAGVAEA